ncbi:hypothetical protein [Ornithinimicrobium cerasi]|uniref:hypothetical protein n=1 Tax=Ornithinimicrobium cerasi TaxID=2248773 RepID=UPI000EFEE443|nr:hypothetical protein [Ornithinimicrobium cerasi]
MTTPEEKRARARLLREVATTISTKAWQLDDDLDTLLRRYPHRTDGVWWGPAATEFYDAAKDVRTDVRALRADVLGYAGDCRARASTLEDLADAQEAELREREAG